MTTQQNNTASLPTDAEIAARIDAEPVPERMQEDLGVRVEQDDPADLDLARCVREFADGIEGEGLRNHLYLRSHAHPGDVERYIAMCQAADRVLNSHGWDIPELASVETRDSLRRERDELLDVLADMIENYRYEVDGSGCARSRCSDCGAFYREPHVGDCIIGKAVGVIGSVSRAAVDRAKATGAPHAAP